MVKYLCRLYMWRDMTEAQVMAHPPTLLEAALVDSFVTEMTTLIPDTLSATAANAFDEERRSGGWDGLSQEVRDVLTERASSFAHGR